MYFLRLRIESYVRTFVTAGDGNRRLQQQGNTMLRSLVVADNVLVNEVEIGNRVQ